MLRVGMHSKGYVLFIVLIFLFVLTLLSVGGSQNIILENKMQNNLRDHTLVFSRAELGMEQATLSIEGDSMSLPYSPIQLTVRTNILSTDDCGNQTIHIQAIAQDAFSTIILNSHDIFASIPREKYCKKIPAHRIIWWKET